MAYWRRGLWLLILLGVFFPSLAKADLIAQWDRMGIQGTDQLEDMDPSPGKEWREPASGILFLWIPGGCYAMGSPPRMEGRARDESPVHQVCLSGFWLANREVTQGQWQGFMHINPAFFRKGDNYPVEHVAWDDVEIMVADLNSRYKGKIHFRLPTEAEWEYACREGGDSMILPGQASPQQLAWFNVNSHQSTQPTSTRIPNRLGLFDMSGNVWEWTQDNYRADGYAQHKSKNPLVTDEGSFRVIRGGSWKEGLGGLRCANRGFEKFSTKRSDIGFRLAAEVDVETTDQRPNLYEMPF